MKIEKYIKYRIVSELLNKVEFRITNQSHIEHFFGDDDNNWWQSSNKILLKSIGSPETRRDLLYVWGRNSLRNNNLLTVVPEAFARYKEAIDEYNRYYAGYTIVIPEDLFTI